MVCKEMLYFYFYLTFYKIVRMIIVSLINFINKTTSIKIIYQIPNNIEQYKYKYPNNTSLIINRIYTYPNKILLSTLIYNALQFTKCFFPLFVFLYNKVISLPHSS